MRNVRYAALVVGVVAALAHSPAPAAPLGKAGSDVSTIQVSLSDHLACAAGLGSTPATRIVIADKTIPQRSRSSFARLVAAADAYGRAVAANEIDRGFADSCRVPTIESGERRLFLRTLEDVIADRSVDSSLLTFREADGALNAVYRQVMAVDDPQSLAWGSVDKAGIRRTERAWLAYRDAFVAFAATLERPDAAERVKIELTTRRATSLEAFLAD